jgi:diguanylate cyclase (GGDEF)-like protein
MYFSFFDTVSTIYSYAGDDADDFKKINDEYGHARGDRVLKIIASTLKNKCPEDGVVCRYGGDEFVIFYPVSDVGIVEEYENDVHKALAMQQISISIGTIVTDPSSSKSFDEYISEADALMYEVKKEKKARR